jgi:hypothetical protein
VREVTGPVKRPSLLALAGALAVGLLGGCDRATFAGPGQVDPLVTSIFQYPIQSDYDQPKKLLPSMQADVWLRPVASYEARVRVLSTERYRFDSLADALPLDLALAWGASARADVQEQLDISQGNRWFFWQSSGNFLPLPRRELERGMANVHIASADLEIEDFLKAAGPTECLWLKGELVDVVSNNPRLNQSTSRNREDTGGGSCEILRVTHAALVQCS